MTVSQMHTAVKLGLDKTSALDLPAFEPEEIDDWLNVAQERFIQERLYKEEIGTKALEDLRTLIKVNNASDSTADVYTTTQIENEHVYVLLPSDYEYSLKVRAEMSRASELGNLTDEWFEVIIVDNIDKYLQTGFNRPYFENPVGRYTTDDTNSIDGDAADALDVPALLVLGDAYVTSIGDVEFTYIKTPDIITYSTISCELPDHTHQTIVDICVNLLIENIESQRFQANTVLLKERE